MTKPRKKLYITAGYNTISIGTGRSEFHPKKPRPGIEYYIKEAGENTVKMVNGAKNIDETAIGNFMAARFNKQANLPGFAPTIDPELIGKPAISVEGACASGGLALISGIKSILSDSANSVMALGFEVQNTVKAMYGADYLAAAGWFGERKKGHAYYFPGKFSDRAGSYFEKFGREKTRKAFAKWFKQAVENARTCPTAQEFENKVDDLEKLALMEPSPDKFVDNLNVFDCSKVSDGASSIAILSEEGLKKSGINKKDCVEIIGFAQAQDDITKNPDDPTILGTTKLAVKKALDSAGINLDQIATFEIHDCFTIAAVLMIEAIGLAEHGKGIDFILDGNTARDGKVPINTTGGLIGWGHPTGCTGVHQAVTIWQQLTGKAGDSQIEIPENKPYGMTVNMGGDDKTVVVVIYKRA